MNVWIEGPTPRPAVSTLDVGNVRNENRQVPTKSFLRYFTSLFTKVFKQIAVLSKKQGLRI